MVTVSPGVPFEHPHIPPVLPDIGQACRAGVGVKGPRSGSRSDAEGALDAGVGEHDDPAEAGRATVDPDDTSRCPLGLCCETCGSGADLSVATAQTPLGIICLTLCGDCAEAGALPKFTAAGAVYRSLDHAEHLGCTVDDLAP